MTTEEMKEYSLRISQCTKTELVVITYDIILNYLESAKVCFKEKDVDNYRFNLKKAKQFVGNLSSNLDFKYKISFELMSLYMYINRTLVSASIRNDDVEIDECVKIISKLREAFYEVSKNDTSGKIMMNTQTVYAGLTYGPGSKLNEYCVR